MSIKVARTKIKSALRELDANRPAMAQLDLGVALEELDRSAEQKAIALQRLEQLKAFPHACPFYHEVVGYSARHRSSMSAEGCELGGDAIECLGDPQDCSLRARRKT